MNVEILDSGGICDWLINRFEVAYSLENVHLINLYIPSGETGIVFRFGGKVNLIRNRTIELPEVFILPVTPKSAYIEAIGKIDLMIVICKSTVFSRVLKMDMELKEGEDFIYCKEKWYKTVWKKMSVLTTPQERVNCFNRFVSENISQSYQPDKIDLLYENIMNHGDTHPLSYFLKTSDINGRSLRRIFIKRTGENIKTLHRLVRVNHFWNKIKNKEVMNFQDLVFECNYYDQSHFIKDFKSIVGESPKAFFKRDLNEIKMISGK